METLILKIEKKIVDESKENWGLQKKWKIKNKICYEK